MSTPIEQASELLRAAPLRPAAALEAAEVVAQHGLVLVVPRADKKRARAAELALKLLRTAASSSGASPNEREIAAHHAAALFNEHDLEFKAAPARRKKPQVPPQPVIITASKRACHKGRTPFAVWKSVITDEAHYCIQCGYVIHEGEIAWHDAWYGYIHGDVTIR